MKPIAAVFCLLAFNAAGFAQTTHYLDCGSANSAGDSLRPESAWNSLAQANAFLFQPGDRLLLHRGSRCEGMLTPKGSGSAKKAIVLGAYGNGALPVIEGGKQKAGLQLMNQSYWEIENIEVLGGSPYAVHIGADSVSIRHLSLRNLVLHGVAGKPETKDSGLLVVSPSPNSPAIVDDVLIDGVTAYDTAQWAGILVAGASYDEQQHRYGNRITIRNSIVHDVAGDGILLMNARNGLIERNVAWNTGLQESETIGTPNAIWEWMCVDCRIAWNEGFFSDSPGVDGGVFDIDYGNVNNIVEHNFAHDSQGYCAAIFGAEGHPGDSVNSIVRDNTCLHNGRSPRLARRQGAIFAYTWHGGRLNGIAIERNTILWEPPLDAPAIHSNAEFFGDLPRTIADNRILLESGTALQTQPQVTTRANQSCARGEGSLRAATIDASDLCSCWNAWTYQLEQQAHSPTQLSASLTKTGQGWRLATTVSGEESRGNVVLLESMLQQFGIRGLHGVLWPQANAALEIDRLRADWHLNPRIEIALLSAPEAGAQQPDPAAIYLLDPSGTVAARWLAPIDAAHLWLALEQRLGTPAGMQPTPVCAGKQ